MRRTNEEMRELIAELSRLRNLGWPPHRIAVELKITQSYYHEIAKTLKDPAPLDKPIVLGWVHPPHIPFKPCR